MRGSGRGSEPDVVEPSVPRFDAGAQPRPHGARVAVVPTAESEVPFGAPRREPSWLTGVIAAANEPMPEDQRKVVLRNMVTTPNEAIRESIRMQRQKLDMLEAALATRETVLLEALAEHLVIAAEVERLCGLGTRGVSEAVQQVTNAVRATPAFGHFGEPTDGSLIATPGAPASPATSADEAGKETA